MDISIKLCNICKKELYNPLKTINESYSHFIIKVRIGKERSIRICSDCYNKPITYLLKEIQ